MTSVVGPFRATPVAPAPPVPAHQAARATAAAAGVEVQILHDIDAVSAVAELFLTIWKPGSMQPPVTGELMRAMAHSGCYVAGAFDRGTLVGACVGFFGAPATRSLHSHIAGVLPAHQGRRIGHALKSHQYAWALDQGLEKVVWTFDPLLRRNAYFNLAKLGATAVEYAVDFYGEMTDGINAGQGSDRVLVAWPVAAMAPDVDGSRRDARPDEARVLLAADADDAPVRGAGADRAPGSTYLVQTPADIELLRRTAPRVARAWRLELREVLGPLVAGGAQVTGFTRDGYYVVQR